MTIAKVTQLVPEILGQASPNANVTQLVAESLAQANPTAKITQLVVEVLSPVVGGASSKYFMIG